MPTDLVLHAKGGALDVWCLQRFRHDRARRNLNPDAKNPLF
jgi:hypothetical protein